jgi:hypothetical protein
MAIGTDILLASAGWDVTAVKRALAATGNWSCRQPQDPNRPQLAPARDSESPASVPGERNYTVGTKGKF